MAIRKTKQKIVTENLFEGNEKNSATVINLEDLKTLISKKKQLSFLIENQVIQIKKDEKKLFIEALLETLELKNTKIKGLALTTQQVADLLNVSRPFIVKLIDSNQLQSFKVGSHRRVYEMDAIAFRKKMRNEQNNAMNALAEETEKLELNFK